MVGKRHGRPKILWTDVIQRDLLNLVCVEGAEIADQEHTVWKIFTSQAAGADRQDADW